MRNVDDQYIPGQIYTGHISYHHRDGVSTVIVPVLILDVEPDTEQHEPISNVCPAQYHLLWQPLDPDGYPCDRPRWSWLHYDGKGVLRHRDEPAASVTVALRPQQPWRWYQPNDPNANSIEILAEHARKKVSHAATQ